MPRFAVSAALAAALLAAPPPAPAATPADTVGRARAAEWLALLPDGDAKRRFVLDCAGCHPFDRAIATVEGEPRSRASWEEAVRRMLGFAGHDTGFPVIAPDREPGPTAEWLATYLDGRAPDPAPARALPEGWAVDEYPLPRPDLPHDVAVAPDGSIVVTGMLTGVMYVLEPATGAWSEVPIPVAQANPRAVEVDADGTWWVVLGAPLKVARRDPAGEWTTWDVGMYAHEAAFDADGGVWVNGHLTKDPELLARLDPATGAVETFEVPFGPTPAGGTTIPYGLRVGPDGRIWMTQLAGGRLVEFDPASGDFAEHPLPTPHSGPRRLDVAPDGTIWIPEFANGRLTRFDPATGAFEAFPLPTPDALPYAARVDAGRGAVWISTGAADLLARFDLATRTFVEIPFPTSGTLVRHIDVDERTGEVWGAYGAFPPRAPAVFRVRPE